MSKTRYGDRERHSEMKKQLQPVPVSEKEVTYARTRSSNKPVTMIMTVHDNNNMHVNNDSLIRPGGQTHITRTLTKT